MNISNIRLGFAANSSSTHSIVWINNADKVKNLKSHYTPCEFGWDGFILSDNNSKNDYLSIILRDNLNNIFKDDDVLVNYILNSLGYNHVDHDGYIDHQSFIKLPLSFNSSLVDIDFFNELKSFLLQNNIIITGGNDNDHDSVLCDLPSPNSIITGLNCITDILGSLVCRKEIGTNYWTLFNKVNGSKILFDFNTDKPKPLLKTLTPQLVDLKITDYCDRNCPFCYQHSTTKGKHADIWKIYEILAQLSKMKVFEVAIGGGDPLSHPYILDILNECQNLGIVPNLTIRLPQLNTDNLTSQIKYDSYISLLQQVIKYTGCIALSIDNNYDYHYINLLKQVTNDYKKKFTIQHILGGSSDITLQQILRDVYDNKMQLTLLGYKNIGRGETNDKYYDEKELFNSVIKPMIKKSKCPTLGFDTCLIRKFIDELKSLDIPPQMYYAQEGTFSCYIDTVNEKLYQSSYQLNKSYDIIDIQKSYQKMQMECVGCIK